HASLRTQNISQPHCPHGTSRTAPSQQCKFCQPLGRPHHTARVYRLIRGHHNERGHVMHSGSLRQEVSPKSVVLDSRDWITFHERYMFEGCSMDYGFGFSLFKYLCKQRAIAYVSNNRGNDV